MARTYDQILQAMMADPTYTGSRKLVEDKMNSIPGSIDNEIAANDAKLSVANQGILDGARRRGLGFSGIPVAEQAKYAATEYAPAIARVRDNGRNQVLSLQEALLGLDRDARTNARGIYDNELARDFQERQFQEQQRQYNETLAFQREQAAQAARAAAGGGGGGYSFGGADFGGGGAPAPQANPLKQQAIAAVNAMMSRRNDPSFYREVQAIAKSAGYGNTMDQAKLELLRASQPGLFKGGQLNTTRINALLGQSGGSGGW